MKDIHILDLPYEVLHLILSNLKCNLAKETEIMIWDNTRGLLPHRAKNMSHAWSSGYFVSYEGRKLFDSLNIQGPVLISRIGLVCSDFYNISKTLWRPAYIQSFRKGIPYKRKYSDNQYRKKYMDYIKKIYTERFNYNKGQLEYYSQMETIKNNNCERYLKVIQDAAMNDKLSHNTVYNITGLYHYSRQEPNLQEVSINLITLERVLQYRRRCLQDANYYKSNIPLYEKRTRYAQHKIDVIC
jgi:hypothetical protein